MANTGEVLTRWAWAQIDLSAIKANVHEVRKKIGPERKICAVVKADAYGHGAIPVAKAALEAGASNLAIATVEEGVELREAGITAPILMLAEPPISAIPTILEYDITPTVTTIDFALMLGEEADAQGKVAAYHLKVNTGMNRIGILAGEVVEFLRAISFSSWSQARRDLHAFCDGRFPRRLGIQESIGTVQGGNRRHEACRYRSRHRALCQLRLHHSLSGGIFRHGAYRHHPIRPASIARDIRQDETEPCDEHQGEGHPRKGTVRGRGRQLWADIPRSRKHPDRDVAARLCRRYPPHPFGKDDGAL